jgi:hypothetical protein
VRNRLPACLLACVVAASSGCGGAHAVSGGTPGIVHTDGVALPDVLVTVYQLQDGAHRLLGSGVTDAEGRFELRRGDPPEALRLDPGEYCFTVESIGEVTMRWPPELSRLDETPLRHTWSTGDRVLDLNVPEPRFSY